MFVCKCGLPDHVASHEIPHTLADSREWLWPCQWLRGGEVERSQVYDHYTMYSNHKCTRLGYSWLSWWAVHTHIFCLRCAKFWFQLVINVTPSKWWLLDKTHVWQELCVSSARVNGRRAPLSRRRGQSCSRTSSTVHTQDSYSLVRPVRVETGAVLTGVLLAFHDVLCTWGAHKPGRTRALVRIPQRLTFCTISTWRRGAVILQLAVLPSVAGRAGTWIAIQTP